MTDDIPLVDIAAQQLEVASDVVPAIERILTAGAFIGGEPVADFEAQYATYSGVRHCVGVGNGTDAIEMALRATGVGPGGEVVLPANTFIATAEAVVRIGAVPVLVDVDDDYLLIDPDRVSAALTRRTQAVVPVHLFGQPAPVEHVAKQLEGTSVVLIEDAAQSQGARRNGVATGGLGVAAATSFYPGKNLGAAGDAGAVLTDVDEVADTVRLLGNHGSRRKYHHEIVGFNSRLDAINAVVLVAKLKRLDAWNDMRRAAAARYDTLLAEVEGVRLPKVMPGNEPVWHLYTVRVRQRDRVLRALNERGIGAGVHYPVPINRTPAFRDANEATDLDVSDRAADELLSLPLYPHITEEQQGRVVATLRAVLSRR